jgi:hypothetical protein
VQLVQLSPFVPHAVSELPVWHAPFASQHPPQFDAPHGGGLPTQIPFVHAEFCDVQGLHAAPLEPQASVWSPVRQRPEASQQPAQFDGPHTGGAP